MTMEDIPILVVAGCQNAKVYQYTVSIFIYLYIYICRCQINLYYVALSDDSLRKVPGTLLPVVSEGGYA